MKRLFYILVISALAACPAKQTDTDNPVTDVEVPSSSGVATGETCGTIAGLTCASDKDYCKMAAGECRIPDMSGTCTVIPEMCTREFRPVCGCDDKTYSNACVAASSGVNVLYEGECKS